MHSTDDEILSSIDRLVTWIPDGEVFPLEQEQSEQAKKGDEQKKGTQPISESMNCVPLSSPPLIIAPQASDQYSRTRLTPFVRFLLTE